jgi:hypothetical protein
LLCGADAKRAAADDAYSDTDGNSHVNCHAGSYADTIGLSWRLFTIANADVNGYSYKVLSDSATTPHPRNFTL